MSHDIFLQLVGRSREVNHAFLLGHYGQDYPLQALIARGAALPGSLPRPACRSSPARSSCRPGRPASAAGDRHVVHACMTVQANLLVHSLTDRFHGVVAHGDYASGKPAPDPFLKRPSGWAWRPALPGAGGFPQRRAQRRPPARWRMVPDLIPPTDEIQGLCTHVVADLHHVCLMLGGQR